MARLAEYIQELAALLGQQADLRLVRIEKGSINLRVKAVGGGTAGRIAGRIAAVGRREAPREAMRAYNRINQMVYEDGGPARLKGPATVLHFPGVAAGGVDRLKIVDYGDITGRLYSLSESRENQLSARIRPLTGEGYVQCTASKEIGRTLRELLFEPVRAYGRGTWREAGNVWICEGLAIEAAWPVKGGDLREAIDALRALEADWPENALDEMAKLDEADPVA
jgi:hypothetical protein